MLTAIDGFGTLPGMNVQRILFFILLIVAVAIPASAWAPANESYRKQFAQADKLVADKKPQEAEKIFSQLAGVEWPLADLAAVRARRLAEKAGRDAQVVDWNERIVAQYPYSRFRPAAMIDLIEHHLGNNQYQPAADLAARHLQDYPETNEAQVRYNYAIALEQLGRKKEAAAQYAETAYWHIGNYAAKAEAKVNQLRRQGWIISLPPRPAIWRKITELFEIRYYYTIDVFAERYARMYPGAADAFRARLVSVDAKFARRKSKDARRQLKELAKIARKKEDKLAVALRQIRYDRQATTAKKKNLYLQAVKLPAGSPTRLDGQLALMYLEWDERNFGAAADWAEQALKDDSRFLFVPADATWHAGFGRYLAGEFQRASALFTRYLTDYPEDSNRDAVQYWLGRTRQVLGDKDGARKQYQQCFDRWKGTYYGLLAEVRLAELGKRQPLFVTQSDVPESQKILTRAMQIPALKQNWEQANGGGTALDEGARQAMEHYRDNAPDEIKPQFAAVPELLALGLDDEAIACLDFIKDRAFRTADGAYFLSVAYGLAEDNLKSIIAANEAYWAVIEGRLSDPHHLVLRRRFPLLFQEMIFPAAKKHGLDPWFAIAVIKQESAFQMKARSWAGARGLMQIMPGTGRVIARRRKIKKFRTSDLYKPEVSLDFGCWLLADYMKKTDGDIPAVLSGYNAGFGRPMRWWPAHEGRTMDELVDLVPFRETKGYIKAIMRNYEMYQRLYKDKPHQQPPRPSVFEALMKKVKLFSS